MPYKPGECGNKGGRPKKNIELVKAAKEHSQAALDTLVALLKHKMGNVRLGAAKEILDRGYGKAPQAVEVGGSIQVRAVIQFG